MIPVRLRNVKNKQEIMDASPYLIQNPKDYYGKWDTVFMNSNPIYLEIGMGKGKFILENAKQNSNVNYLGMEKQDSVLAKGLLKIEDGVPNLKVIRGDAFEIDEMFSHEISHLYLNFSDPWPKKRHHLRRLSSKIFLEKYNSIFFKTPVIEMRTDNLDLFQYSLLQLSQHGYRFDDLSFDFHKDHEVEITTEYEDRFSSKGNPIYYVLCHKENVN